MSGRDIQGLHNGRFTHFQRNNADHLVVAYSLTGVCWRCIPKNQRPVLTTGLCRIWQDQFLKRGVKHEHNSIDFLAMVAIFQGQLWPGVGLLSF